MIGVTPELYRVENVLNPKSLIVLFFYMIPLSARPEDSANVSEQRLKFKNLSNITPRYLYELTILQKPDKVKLKHVLFLRFGLKCTILFFS